MMRFRVACWIISTATKLGLKVNYILASILSITRSFSSILLLSSDAQGYQTNLLTCRVNKSHCVLSDIRVTRFRAKHSIFHALLPLMGSTSKVPARPLCHLPFSAAAQSQSGSGSGPEMSKRPTVSM